MLDEVDESYAIRKTMDMKANNKNKATKSKKQNQNPKNVGQILI